jgi:uncharacterized protein DUF2865
MHALQPADAGMTLRLDLAAALLLAATVSAQAQVWPPGPGAPPSQPYQSQVCTRLEAQLGAVDRGPADPGRAEQIKRYEDAAGRQQAELDRTVAQARRMGCEGRGFFLFGGQPQQCGELDGQIQRMRANLDRVLTDLQRLQGGNIDRGEQRRSILIALAENNCGPQYRTTARSRGFFEQLFGPPAGTIDNPGGPEVASGNYRTLCVRTCDGFYFPISYATTPARFRDDERICQRMCPASEAVLFSHRNPGEEVSQATSINGMPYSQLPNAFRYRTEYNAACTCKQPGQSWADALGRDETVEQGDIVVTEDRAKQLSAPPKAAQPKAKDARQKKANEPEPAPAAQPAPTPAPAAAEEPGKRTIRSVGPTFIPAR